MIKRAAASTWRSRVIATRFRGGPVTFLLRVTKSACRRCRYGIRFETVWGSEAGTAHRVTWCQSCFNADCTEVDLPKQLQGVWKDTVSRVDDPAALTFHPGARSAVEDLEQQGLV